MENEEILQEEQTNILTLTDENGTDVDFEYLDCIDYEICTAKCLLAVFHTQIAFNLAVASHGLTHGFQNGLAFFQAFSVNVVESKGTVPQHFGAHAVPDDVPGENGATRTHKGQFHGKVLL